MTGWYSKRRDRRGEVKTGHLSKEMMAAAQIVVPGYLQFLTENKSYELDVRQFASWVKQHHKNIVPFLSAQTREEVRKKNPGKIILDMQALCYDLSSPGSFWIETANGKMVAPLSDVKGDRMTYTINQNWKSQLLQE